jgi:hypothetical protein
VEAELHARDSAGTGEHVRSPFLSLHSRHQNAAFPPREWVGKGARRSVTRGEGTDASVDSKHRALLAVLFLKYVVFEDPETARVEMEQRREERRRARRKARGEDGGVEGLFEEQNGKGRKGKGKGKVRISPLYLLRDELMSRERAGQS